MIESVVGIWSDWDLVPSTSGGMPRPSLVVLIVLNHTSYTCVVVSIVFNHIHTWYYYKK